MALHNLQNIVTTVTVWEKLTVIPGFLLGEPTYFLEKQPCRFILPAGTLEP